MTETLVTAGLACVIAAIVGGGLKAFGLHLPVLTSLPRQGLLAAFGAALIIAGMMERESDPPPDPPPEPTRPGEITIRYSQLGGPFIVLGPNPGGEFVTQGDWWHQMDLLVENSCDSPFYVDPTNFTLYLSPSPEPSEGQPFYPTNRGVEFQTLRIAAGWLQPGDQREGRLTFQVPDALPDGTETNGAYHLIRYRAGTPCPVTYEGQ